MLRSVSGRRGRRRSSPRSSGTGPRRTCVRRYDGSWRAATCGDGLRCEVGAPITLLGFELGQDTDVLAGLVALPVIGVDPDVGNEGLTQAGRLRHQGFELVGVALGSSCGLCDQAQEPLAGVGRGVLKPPLHDSALTAALAATLGVAPPWSRQTVAPTIALFLH